MARNTAELARKTTASASAEARRSVAKGRVSIDKVAVVFGRDAHSHMAVAQTSLEISPGEFVCLLGPSGCGKSTLLNCVAGYVRPSHGRITVDGVPVTKPGPDRGMVFQQYSLFPWKTVFDNIAFGPRIAGKGDAEATSITRTLLEMVGLSRFAKRYPGELSGGMQQRVGIARALANYPAVLLMDEPFGALDSQTRAMMQQNLLRIRDEFGITVLFVTHDVDEALFLADRVLVMSASPGRIIADIAVPLGRPRSPAIATEDGFVRLKRRCLDIISVESLRAFEQQDR
jgi:NitT/TauT family transport system ATP-binding protein